ncbi:hypothetical protein CAEBREN_03884 [Caenorhabditis brenneri]|uniref:Uncharacterized protein n=1 Tax=Caenorhabditis brenneri TaxID=135651 RepID=G0NCM4_CAEBE|nr:hypothetical protein CAEBREN_03884 [Caenorhabditis brenneri]
MIAIARTAFETERLIQAAFEAQARCLAAHRANTIRWGAEDKAKAQGLVGEEVEHLLPQAELKGEDQVSGATDETVGDWDEERKLRLVRSYSLMPSPAFRIDVKVWSSEEVPQAQMAQMVDLCLLEDTPTTAGAPTPSERLLASLRRAQAAVVSASPALTRSPSQRLLAALARAQAITAAPTCAPPPSQLILESLSRAQSEAEEVRKAQRHLRALLEEMKQRCERWEKLMAKENEDRER